LSILFSFSICAPSTHIIHSPIKLCYAPFEVIRVATV